MCTVFMVMFSRMYVCGTSFLKRCCVDVLFLNVV